MTTSTSSLNAIVSSSSSFASVNNILADEYGITCLAEVRAYLRQTDNRINDTTLIESVVAIERKSMNQRLAAAVKRYEGNLERAERDFENRECYLGASLSTISEEAAIVNYNRNVKYYEIEYHSAVSEILSNHNLAVKTRYARTVAMSLPLSDFERKLFVELRLAKAWDFTETSSCIELADIVKEHIGEDLSTDRHYMGSYYKATFRTVAELASKGLSLSQIERFLKEVGYMKDRYTETGRCISTFNQTFTGGFHFGTWFAMTVHGINQSHVRDFSRFMRVFSFTKFISPKLSHRHLVKLDKLDKLELKMTVTDSRNWTSNNSHGNRGFRLTAVVRNVTDWQPVRKNHLVDAVWLSKFGRIPANHDVKNIDVDVVSSFSKNGFGKFIKEINDLGVEGQHNILALAKIHTCLGAEWKSYFKADSRPDFWELDTADSVVTNIHDIGINFPSSMSNDQRKFFRRNNHNFDDSIRVIKAWDIITEQGINPLGKEGLKVSMAYVQTLIYDGVKDFKLAQECAKYGYSQQEFDVAQAQWQERKKIPYESVPNVNLSSGDWKFYRLDRDDVRGPFLGEYTGCCQHPRGAGASCAKHGTIDPDGAFVVLEYRGEIKFQSWVWRDDDSLTFDNIEGGCNSSLYEEAKAIYKDGIELFRNKFGIKHLFVGTGGSDIRFKEMMAMPAIVSIKHASIYSDAREVWLIE